MICTIVPEGSGRFSLFIQMFQIFVEMFQRFGIGEIGVVFQAGKDPECGDSET